MPVQSGVVSITVGTEGVVTVGSTGVLTIGLGFCFGGAGGTVVRVGLALVGSTVGFTGLLLTG